MLCRVMSGVGKHGKVTQKQYAYLVFGVIFTASGVVVCSSFVHLHISGGSSSHLSSAHIFFHYDPCSVVKRENSIAHDPMQDFEN